MRTIVLRAWPLTGAFLAGGLTASPAAVAGPANPCLGPDRAQLRCPDLVMAAPRNFYAERLGGRVILRSTSELINRGTGPAELHGSRSGATTMRTRQGIYRVNRSRLTISSRAYLRFTTVPGFGPFWKWRDAARFELWSVDDRGRRLALVRAGGKKLYCLRDYAHPGPRFRFSPPRRVYPACSQERRRRAVVLGTSVGWSDYYPASYPQQFIDVTGLRGRFAYVHVADPVNGMMESNETNNVGATIVSLPPANVEDPADSQY